MAEIPAAKIPAVVTVEVVKTHKPFWQTSEFWVTQLTISAIIAGALDGVLPPKWAAIALSISQAAYAIARAITKSGLAEKISFLDNLTKKTGDK